MVGFMEFMVDCFRFRVNYFRFKVNFSFGLEKLVVNFIEVFQNFSYFIGNFVKVQDFIYQLTLKSRNYLKNVKTVDILII
jgi:hypothetical protein